MTNESEPTAQPRLCYVEDSWAYFTTQDVEKQWGDDWDDAPYEHNAGRPYEWREYNGEPKWRIVIAAWRAPYETPAAWVMNSPYAVRDINAKRTPWLTGAKYTHEELPPIWAGTPLREFCEMVRDAGGHVYLEMG